MTRFILVRHGQTVWNREERFRGRADVSLDEIGRRQAEATGRRIAAGWRPAAIYCSPMIRARQTAEAIAGALGASPLARLAVQTHSRLSDIDFGALQGLTVEEARAGWPAVVDSWLTAPQTTLFPGGESLSELRSRATAMLAELAERHDGQELVLVGHTVVNRVILLAVMGLGLDRFWRLTQDTCAINVFDSDQGGYTVVSVNDTCHLRDLDAGR